MTGERGDSTRAGVVVNLTGNGKEVYRKNIINLLCFKVQN